jgi:phospho-N-acetylmuramoyl-pentapeptide-transferase
MLYHLLYPLAKYFSPLNIFRYITFRAAMASLMALLLGLMAGPRIIELLRKLNIREAAEKKDSPALKNLHQVKKGTPTMGGLIIILSTLIPTIFWARLDNVYILWSLVVVSWLGLIGYLDDFLKRRYARRQGLSASTKLAGQIGLGLVLGLFFYRFGGYHGLGVPFFKDLVIPLSWGYVLLVIVVMAASSNAVNLTDGLDGLAIGCMIMASLTFGGIAYITGHIHLSSYLKIPHVDGSGEIAIFCASLIGASRSFLWFNAYPAQVFMGDTGALTLGGAIGYVAVVLRQELLLFVVGGVFVIEALSVVLQVISFKLTGKRIFACAPLHHHLEIKGMAEPKVVVRFWILAALFALLSLSTLKIR